VTREKQREVEIAKGNLDLAHDAARAEKLNLQVGDLPEIYQRSTWEK
jgi:hypothetical protein